MTEPSVSPGRKIVVVGKGGVGKSTVTALMARTMARSGRSVLAVDADEQRNLAACLGLTAAEAHAITPLADASAYITERAGSRGGGLLRLNPDTSDVVERFAVEAPDGVRLLVMGGVRSAGGGCLCPETTVLAAAVAGLRLLRDDVVIMDTHAGAEHFGRALSRGFDTALVVADPTLNGLDVGIDAAGLAFELGIPSIRLVVNKVRSAADEQKAFAHAVASGVGFDDVAFLPLDPAAADFDAAVDRLLPASPLARGVSRLCRRLSLPGRVLECES